MKAPNLDRLKGHALTIEGRAFTVIGVTQRNAAGFSPPLTRIEVHAAPALRVDLALPMEWNGRLYMTGNGGYAGEAFDNPLQEMGRAKALAGGYAVISTNTGHDEAADPLAAFATDREKLIDYAHRAVHQAAMVGKALVQEIYARPPEYTYFEGCSTGGRQALMAAQRYPEDFDGIISGCPVLDFTGSQLWGVRTGQFLAGVDIGDREMEILSSVLHTRFGAREGRSPELIDNPIGADFDVARDVPISADGEPAEGSLTRTQAEALAKVYAPAPIGGGRTFPGLPIGGEAIGGGLPGVAPASGWAGWLYPSDEGFFAGAPAGVRVSFGETFLREMLGYRGRWQDFDYSDGAMAGVEELSALLNATDPDLGPLAKEDGKLILYHSAADVAVNPARTVEYYESIRAEMGDRADACIRFYLAPGMFHCFGGYGPDQFDMLPALVDWVEHGKSPATIIASQRPNPSDPQDVWTRPLCPYPAIAKYDGQGDPASAGSYACVSPH